MTFSDDVFIKLWLGAMVVALCILVPVAIHQGMSGDYAGCAICMRRGRTEDMHRLEADGQTAYLCSECHVLLANGVNPMVRARGRNASNDALKSWLIYKALTK